LARHRQGIDRGLEFGCWLGLAAFVGVAGGMASIVVWPLKVPLGMALQQMVNNVVIGFFLTWVVSRPRFLINEKVTEISAVPRCQIAILPIRAK